METSYQIAQLREDIGEKKVYRYMENIGDVLIYDFSLEEGESTTIYSAAGAATITIESVELIEVGGTQRKKLSFTDLGRPAYWIEGIGSCYGIHDAALGVISDYEPVLLCFYSNDVLRWSNPDMNTVCMLTLNAGELHISFGLTVWPNPFQDKIFIQSNDKITGDRTYVVTSVTGQTVLSGQLPPRNNSVVELELPTLASGIYLLSVMEENGSSQSVRLVKGK